MGKGGRTKPRMIVGPRAAQFAAYLRGVRDTRLELDALRDALDDLIVDVDHSRLLSRADKDWVITGLRQVQRARPPSP
jgi:hypothetical protein